MHIPERLRWLAQQPEGALWLAQLPQRLARCAERWSLQLGEPFPRCFIAYVVPVTTAAGQRRVLKVQFPHLECFGEAAALRAWDGGGAVQLIEHAPELDALLLERCEPGASLESATHAEADAVVVDLLRCSFVPAGPPIPMLCDQLDAWAKEMSAVVVLPGEFVELAEAVMRRLSATAKTMGLVNLDLHRDNVLRAKRQPWLVIDPKPILGEQALGLANRLPMYGIGEIDEAAPRVGARLSRMSAALGLPPERAGGWAFVRAVMWAGDNSPLRSAFLETARQLEPVARAIVGTNLDPN